MYNLQRPLEDTLALSRTQGCYFSERGGNVAISTKRNIYKTQDVFSNFLFVYIQTAFQGGESFYQSREFLIDR